MKWVGISGSWHNVSPQLVEDVKREVHAVLSRGDGIVTGGALGVDFLATETALQMNGRRLRVILPTSLATYARHYRNCAQRGVITCEQAEELIAQLEGVQASWALIEMHEQTVVDTDAYCRRNSEVVNAADELLAFHVNGSAGVQDTIDKARAARIPVRVLSYWV